MTDDAGAAYAQFNQGIVEEFRANDGVVGGPFAGAPMILITTTGAKSGAARTSPLVFTRDGDDYVIIASMGGAPKHPAWFHNIVAHPTVEVEVGKERFTATATVHQDGPERRRLFDAQAAVMPDFTEYEAKTDRVIPVVTLTPINLPRVSPPLELRFVLSGDRIEALPDSEVEIAVVGRSNVGKSSLLNALANRKGLANVSKTPGRTQLLNCFEMVGLEDRTVIDCPGYGYAAVSKTQRASWGRMIDKYLLEREQLAMVMVLVDGEIGPTKLDVQLLDWLRANALPHQVIATKHDKVKSSQREKRKKDLAAGCDLEPGDVVWVSAAKNVNLDKLRDLVRIWLEVPH